MGETRRETMRAPAMALMKMSIKRRSACRKSERTSCSSSTSSRKRRQLRRRSKKRMCLKRAVLHPMSQLLIGDQEGNLEIDYSLILTNKRYRKKIT